MKEKKYPLKSGHIKIIDSIVVNDGEGYSMRGTRMDIGAFSIVTIEWNHPNYGYFADYMMWIKSLHMSEWKPFPIAGESENYDFNSFLKMYPEFIPLFEERDLIGYIVE